MGADSNDVMRKAVKLAPNKKSGKEKHTLYKGLNQMEDQDDDFEIYTKKESILDYFDDEEDDEDYDEEYDEDDEE